MAGRDGPPVLHVCGPPIGGRSASEPGAARVLPRAASMDPLNGRSQYGSGNCDNRRTGGNSCGGIGQWWSPICSGTGQSKEDFVGNIYKGKVAKVLPGMQAAFVDIGLEKAAFMHVSDLSLDAEPATRCWIRMKTIKTGTKCAPVEKAASPSSNCSQKGRSRWCKSRRGRSGPRPRVTTHVSLPGRYLVFMPNVEHIGASRRIARDEERARLKDIMKRVRNPGCGYIVRTVRGGEGGRTTIGRRFPARPLARHQDQARSTGGAGAFAYGFEPELPGGP